MVHLYRALTSEVDFLTRISRLEGIIFHVKGRDESQPGKMIRFGEVDHADSTDINGYC